MKYVTESLIFEVSQASRGGVSFQSLWLLHLRPFSSMQDFINMGLQLQLLLPSMPAFGDVSRVESDSTAIFFTGNVMGRDEFMPAQEAARTLLGSFEQMWINPSNGKPMGNAYLPRSMDAEINQDALWSSVIEMEDNVMSDCIWRIDYAVM